MTTLWAALVLLAIPAPAPADRLQENIPSTPRPAPDDDPAGSVTLPLDDYVELVERIERTDEARRAPAELAVAELTAQATAVTVDGSAARVRATYQVELRGRGLRPVSLPVTGMVKSATVGTSARGGEGGARGAALHRKSGELLLVAPEPGSYTVEVDSVAELEVDGGVSRLELVESRAGVATLALDLAADASWTLEHAVVVESRPAGGRRHVLVAPERGARPVLELRRVAGGEAAERTRARAVVVTAARIGGDRLERHDVVLYEVSRGELARFEVDVPGGLTVEQAATDEGAALPILDGGRLTVERERRLEAAGHLTLAFPAWRLPEGAPHPAGPGTDVPLPEIEPAVPVRARYLVLASDRAAEVEPLPAEAWSRVDLEDLPRDVQPRIAALGASALWRRREGPVSPRLRVALHEPIEALETVVRRRSTTTLLTVDGALVYRDHFTLHRGGAAFELSLPPGARLWSASVDGQAVRPVRRGGTLAIPLVYKIEGTTEIEVVAVEERRIEPGVSRLEMAVPRVTAPVIEHQWRLLLPERGRYRLAGSDLRPASPGEATPHESVRAESNATVRVVDAGSGSAGVAGTVVDDAGFALAGATVTVTGAGGTTRTDLSGADGRFAVRGLTPGNLRIVASLDGFESFDTRASVPAGKTARIDVTLPISQVSEEIVVTAESPMVLRTGTYRNEVDLAQRRQAARRELASLEQGLVGGVKPLAVDIPESGKLLLLAGVLPPPDVGVTLEVKVKR